MERQRYEVIFEFDAVEQNNRSGVLFRVVPPIAIFADTEVPGVVRFTFEGNASTWLVDSATFTRCTRPAPLISDI